MKNPYLPIPMLVKKATVETTDRMLRTLELGFLKEDDAENFRFVPGQFCELSILGKGEAPFGIASSPTENGSLRFTINKAGVVTTALHQIEEGSEIGIRGPLGNGYPIDLLEGKNLLVISHRGWKLYFPYAVLVKTPLPVFGIAAIAAWAAGSPNRARRSVRQSGRGAGRLVLRTYRTAPLWVFLATYWAVALSVHTLSIGERHLLPTFPAVFILCGAAGRWIQYRQRLCVVALLGSMVWLVIESVEICPSYLSYFNQLAGGPTEGYRHLVDSSLDWGQDLVRLREWLQDRSMGR